MTVDSRIFGISKEPCAVFKVGGPSKVPESMFIEVGSGGMKFSRDALDKRAETELNLC